MRNSSIIVYLFLLLSSCQTGPFFEKNSIIPNQEWKEVFQPQFQVEILDTTARYDVFLNIRHSPYYGYSNLFLSIAETAVDSVEYINPLIEVQMADGEGKWMGKSAGHLYELTEIVEENRQFPDTGLYIFQIRHQMQEASLVGINDIGLKVIKK